MAMAWASVFLLLLAVHLSAAGLQRIKRQADITCSQGLTNCEISNGDSLMVPDSIPVEVYDLNVKAEICCESNNKCKPCIWVKIHLRILPDADEEPLGELSRGSSGGSSDDPSEDYDDKDRGAVTLCYDNGVNGHCKFIRFIVTSAARENSDTTAEVTVVEYNIAFLGSTVNVSVSDTGDKPKHKLVDFPKLEEVCRDFSYLEECKTPRIYTITDVQKGVVRLEADPEDVSHPLTMCVKRQEHGACWLCPRTFPLHDIAPCMCFQALTNNSVRLEICPFTNYSVSKENISLSVTHMKTNEGRLALNWTLKAPCRQDAELWLCRDGNVLEGCSEVKGYRTKLDISSPWKQDSNMLWTSGAFVIADGKDNQLHCVKYAVGGKMFGPVCPTSECTRCRHATILAWSLTLLVLGLATGGVYLLWRKLKVWISKAVQTHHTLGRCGEVLLVHSSGSDLSHSDAVCRFADLLSELGFSVSLDLWNQAAVSNVGPMPWLHAKLQHIQVHRGKTLLVLSHDALQRATACWDSWNGEKKTEDSKPDDKSCSFNADVFGAALSCISSAHLKGSAMEPFALVQFDSEKLIMPELFQGLRLYQLPSDSQCLLADLHTRQPGSIRVRVKRFFWTCMAAARLEKGLKDYEEQRSRTESMLTQEDTVSIGREKEEEEKLPLQI